MEEKVTIPKGINANDVTDLGGDGAVWNDVKGLLWYKQVPFIYRISMDFKEGAHILEIGSNEGLSSVLLGLPSLIYKDRTVTCVDPHTWFKDSWRKWLANIFRFHLGGHVSGVLTTSDEFFYFTRNETYDLVFIDGDHHFETVTRDVINAWCRLKPGGLLMVHDVEENWPGPENAWGMIERYLTDIENCGSLFCGKKVEIKS